MSGKKLKRYEEIGVAALASVGLGVYGWSTQTWWILAIGVALFVFVAAAVAKR